MKIRIKCLINEIQWCQKTIFQWTFCKGVFIFIKSLSNGKRSKFNICLQIFLCLLPFQKKSLRKIYSRAPFHREISKNFGNSSFKTVPVIGSANNVVWCLIGSGFNPSKWAERKSSPWRKWGFDMTSGRSKPTVALIQDEMLFWIQPMFYKWVQFRLFHPRNRMVTRWPEGRFYDLE